MVLNIAAASFLCMIVGYLIGGIMTAVNIAKKKQVDIRKCGSGNAGSTNVLRTFGWKWGLVCLTTDVAKGAVAVLIGCAVGKIGASLDLFSERVVKLIECCSLLGAVLGHLFPLFYNFRGGKCVAVGMGGLLALAPMELLAAVVLAVVLIIITKTVSVGSVVGAIAAAALIVVNNWGDIPLMIAAFAVAAVIVITHIPNIQRIMQGRERKLEKVEWEKRNASENVLREKKESKMHGRHSIK